ncbi:hypothetical protein PBPRB2000 [Photobacterium profundum SS9]|uniref:Uncharacterized protein n=1 Tax=Photobacterium profundum (strain SS9) TaxID=298386 RepID=Q6LFT5_PHOPR|nr:hypothetical protein PBPRB2000 [Photobacterium profundum SS9]
MNIIIPSIMNPEVYLYRQDKCYTSVTIEGILFSTARLVLLYSPLIFRKSPFFNKIRHKTSSKKSCFIPINVKLAAKNEHEKLRKNSKCSYVSMNMITREARKEEKQRRVKKMLNISNKKMIFSIKPLN